MDDATGVCKASTSDSDGEQVLRLTAHRSLGLAALSRPNLLFRPPVNPRFTLPIANPQTSGYLRSAIRLSGVQIGLSVEVGRRTAARLGLTTHATQLRLTVSPEVRKRQRSSGFEIEGSK